jgi:hypothetical protein
LQFYNIPLQGSKILLQGSKVLMQRKQTTQTVVIQAFRDE